MTNRLTTVTLSIALVLTYLLSQEALPSAHVDPYIYNAATEEQIVEEARRPESQKSGIPAFRRSGFRKLPSALSLTARWWGLSAMGTMEILGNTEFRGEDVVLVRSQVTELGGFLGFIVRFLRIYKESNTFDSYIESDTFMTIRYEVYNLNDDGSKKLSEHIYFDRERNRVVSLTDNKTIISNAALDIQDAFSIFLDLIHKFNTEELFVGKRFKVNLYAYKKSYKVEIEVTHLALVNGTAVYTLEIKELPAVFKYPTAISFEVTDVRDGLKLPTRGKCTIHVPVLPDIAIEGELKEIRYTN